METGSISKEKSISKQHAFFIAYVGGIGNSIFNSFSVAYSGRADWLVHFIAVFLMIPFAIWILYLGGKYPEHTIIQIIEATLGKIISKIISVIYIFVIAIVAITLLINFSQSVSVLFLRYTPVWTIMIFIIIISIIITKSGIRRMAELSGLLLFTIIINFFGSYTSVFFKNFKFELIYPIFDTNIYGFARGLSLTTAISSEFILVMMVIIGSISQPSKYYSSISTGVAAFAVTHGVSGILIIGTNSAELFAYSVFLSAPKVLYIGEFIKGVEVFTLYTTQVCVILNISYYLHCIQKTAIHHLTNKKLPVILLIFAALLIFIPSVWVNSYIKAYFLYMGLLCYIPLAFSIFLLLLASLGIILKKKKSGSVTS